MLFFGFIVLGKGVAIFKLSYNYMKMISLQNVMEKIINDIITLFLCEIHFLEDFDTQRASHQVLQEYGGKFHLL